jgi:hypothetical protein
VCRPAPCSHSALQAPSCQLAHTSRMNTFDMHWQGQLPLSESKCSRTALTRLTCSQKSLTDPSTTYCSTSAGVVCSHSSDVYRLSSMATLRPAWFTSTVMQNSKSSCLISNPLLISRRRKKSIRSKRRCSSRSLPRPPPRCLP